MPSHPVDTPLASNSVGQPIPSPFPAIRLGTSQNVIYNAAGGASVQSLAFGVNTNLIMVVVPTNDVRVATGQPNPVATATSTLLPAPGVYLLHVSPGDLMAILGNDTGGGSVNITEAAGV